MNIIELKKWKTEGRKLTMVTCYDAWSAKIINESAIDIVLVGDSSAMVMHGFDDTIPSTVEMIATHVSAVRRGAPKKFIVADLPFLSFRGADALANVRKLIQAGAHAVKLEGFDGNGEFVRSLTEAGVPVMGHVGLTPQFVNAFGGFRVQGREEEQRRKIMSEARGLEEAGCFSSTGAGIKFRTVLSICLCRIGGGGGGGGVYIDRLHEEGRERRTRRGEARQHLTKYSINDDVNIVFLCSLDNVQRF